MTIEAQWTALENEAHGLTNDTWRLRLARPVGGHPLFAAVSSGRRALLLRTTQTLVPARSDWPSCSGLEVVALTLDSHVYLGVVLKEARFADVFATLAEDLARRIETAEPGPGAAIAVFLGQLRRWQRFLASSLEGLDAAAQRGLWGELHLLHTLLLPALGPSAALAGWKGPEGAHQDFQYASAWVEVKTTLAKQPQAVRITSERQLDDSHGPALFLHVLALESQAGGPDTLPACVAALRSALASVPATREIFEDALLAVGYRDRDAPRYSTPGYAVRRADTFRVVPRFPRLIESQLPTGVGDVAYALDLAACAPFMVTPATFSGVLVNTVPPVSST
jgi:Putative  PD-(D/E)XK family member, (DUF4420)